MRKALLTTTFILISASSIHLAVAHDWYSGIQNPRTGKGCCGISDCHPLMLDEISRLSESDTHFIIDNKYFFPKDAAMPAKEVKPGESGYHFCIGSNETPLCFFYPQAA